MLVTGDAAGSSRTISALIRSHGRRIVVSGASVASAAGESSKPPAATSSGTRRPAPSRVAGARCAMEATKTASRSGARSSSAVIAASPLDRL